MKWLGLLCVIMGCTGVGFLLDAKKKLSLKEVENLIFVFELLKGEIDYGLTPLAEACHIVAASALPELRGIFEEFEEGINARISVDLDLIWRQSIESHKAGLHIEEEVYGILQQFGAAVGYLDKEMQKKNIEILLSKLRHIYDRDQAHYEKTSKLNTTIGMLAGACVAILLV